MTNEDMVPDFSLMSCCIAVRRCFCAVLPRMDRIRKGKRTISNHIVAEFCRYSEVDNRNMSTPSQTLGIGMHLHHTNLRLPTQSVRQWTVVIHLIIDNDHYSQWDETKFSNNWPNKWPSLGLSHPTRRSEKFSYMQGQPCLDCLDVSPASIPLTCR